MSTVSLNMKRVHRVGGRTRGSFRKVPENGIRCDLVKYSTDLNVIYSYEGSLLIKKKTKKKTAFLVKTRLRSRISEPCCLSCTVSCHSDTQETLIAAKCQIPGAI